MAVTRSRTKSILFFLLNLIAVSKCQQLRFGGNVGTGLYQYSYTESNDTSNIQSPLPEGQFVVQCLLDGVPSPNITYSLLDNGGGTFRINPNTGALALEGGERLDYESEDSYLMSAACDILNSTIPRGVAQINFNVLPVNEFKPVMRITTRPGAFAQLNEFSEVGQVIAIREINNVQVPSNAYGYTITDRDEGEVEQLSLFQSSSFDSSLFNLEPSGTIRLAKKLDLDDGTQPRVDLVDVRICNSLPPTGISCGNLFVVVVISWSNDNDPTFSQETYAVTIPENISPGSLVANVSCTDGDFVFGAFESVTSSLELFNVSVTDASYQLIYLTGPLDYETQQDYNVLLTCMDNEGKNTTASLSVTIMPINDNPPVFSESSYVFQVSRFLTLGSEIGRVQARDADMAVGNTLTYTLTNTTNFVIEPDGTVILRDFVYVIEGQTFQLLATVSDGEFNSTARVTITMTGVVSIPEVILICMGAVIFIVLAIFIIVCCCFIGVCCSRLLPKKRVKTVSSEMLADDSDAVVLEPVMFPMQPMGNMYQQGKGPAYMLGKVPTETEDHYDRSLGNPSDTDFDDLDQGSMRTTSSHMYTPSSYLTEMLEKFKEGDKILDGKKSKKSAS